MPRARTTSPHAKKANTRITGMTTIGANLDLGDGVSVASLTSARDIVLTTMAAYNELLALATQKGNELEEAEKVLAELNAKALSLVGVRFGVDSSQYQSVGGTRTSDRKRRRPAVG